MNAIPPNDPMHTHQIFMDCAVPLPTNEAERLRSLRRMQLLDSLPEQAYDDLVTLAATICGTPMAMVSLVDADRQWFKAKVGTDLQETPRSVAFCAYAVLQPDAILVVPDALADPRFATNPLVTDPPHLRFYAGAPLVLADGTTLGTLCVVDTVPRTLSPGQIRALAALRRSVVNEIELRTRQSDTAAQRLTLANVLHQLTRELDPDRIIQQAVEAIRQLNRWESVGISLPMPDGLTWQTRAEDRMNPGEVGKSHPLTYGVIGRAFRTGEVQLVDDAHADPDFFLAEGVDAVGSELAVPIRFEGEVLGVLNLESHLPRAFDDEDVAFAYSITEVLAIALSNARRFASLQRENHERLRAEAALRASELRYRLLFATMSQGIVYQDTSGAIIDANPAAQRVLGLSLDQMQGRTSLDPRWQVLTETGDPLPGDQHPAMIALRTGRPIYNSLMAVFNPVLNQHRWLMVNAMPIFAPGAARPSHVYTAFEDITERRITEQALVNHIEQYRSLMRSFDGVVITLSLDERLLYANEQTGHLFGQPVEALIGQSLHALFAPQVAKALSEYCQEVIRQDRGRVIESEGLLPSSERHWYRLSIQPIHDQHGRVSQTLINATDIHSLKTLQQELLTLTRTLETRIAERTKEVRDLYEHAPAGYHSLDADGRFVRINQTALTWLGYSRDELLGQHFTTILTPANQQLFVTNFAQLKIRGAMHNIEYEFQRKQGESFPVLLSATAVYDGAGNFVMTRSTVIDVSDRRRAESALRESRASLQSFLDTASDLIQILDASGTIRYVNSAWCETLGYRREDVLGRSIYLFVAPNYRDPYRKVREALLQDGQPRQTEVIFQTSKGAAVVVEGQIWIRQSTEGQAVTNAIFRDVTRRKQIEEALRVANTEMERALRTKDEFMATMSHELRTPLNAILAVSETLREELHGPLNPHQHESLGHIETSGRHLLALINDILDLSRVEAGLLDIQPEPVPVNEVCHVSVQFIRAQATQKSLLLQLDLEEAPPIVYADPRRLKQMLVNLLSNAVKFTPPGGQVSLRVTARSAQNQVTFTVSDTGIGIAPGDQARLFKPFTQLDSRLSRQHEGTGLGLALVHRLITIHGGTITVESAPGLGSHFRLNLPLHPSSPEVEEAEPTPLAGAMAITRSMPASTKVTSQARLLLVDDNPINLQVLTDYLQARGFAVITAQHGHEALRLAVAEAPDLILMDIQMPELDGFEVIKLLRATTMHATTPIIALTALAMPGDRERCLAAGASTYLARPVVLKELLQTIHTLLGW
ncbi:MAG: PAS domain S-box protein [Oscillochloridaceae bacterium umkhey_bin13]